MTARARREYAAALRRRHAVAARRERSRILDEGCRTTGAHRKSAIRIVRGAGRPAGRAARVATGPGSCRRSSASGSPATGCAASSSWPSCPRCSRPWSSTRGSRSRPQCGRRSWPPARPPSTGGSAPCAAPAHGGRTAPVPPWRPCASRCRCGRGVSGPPCRPATCRATSSSTAGTPPPASPWPRSWPSTWPRRGRSWTSSGARASTGSAAPSLTCARACPSPARLAQRPRQRARQRPPARSVPPRRRAGHPGPARVGRRVVKRYDAAQPSTRSGSWPTLGAQRARGSWVTPF